MIHSPSFILDRREKRKQREADLEKKARNIRSHVKALERRRSDFYSIAQERGRRREVVFKSSERKCLGPQLYFQVQRERDTI